MRSRTQVKNSAGASVLASEAQQQPGKRKTRSTTIESRALQKNENSVRDIAVETSTKGARRVVNVDAIGK